MNGFDCVPIVYIPGSSIQFRSWRNWSKSCRYLEFISELAHAVRNEEGVRDGAIARSCRHQYLCWTSIRCPMGILQGLSDTQPRIYSPPSAKTRKFSRNTWQN